MSERTSYTPGTFSWADLATNDLAGAKAFYEGLFGWEFEDTPAGESGIYSMARLGGLNVGAASEFPDQPPHWNSYVTVANVDDAAARAKELGGTLVAEPFDVMTAGRMAIVQDPTGAMLCIWQARENIGAQLVNEPGAMTWNDLMTTDVDAAATFYGDWFGWRTEEIPGAYGYRVIYNGDRSNGGMLPKRPDMGDVPPNWMPYFGTEDVEQAVTRVPELGGRVLTQPMPVPNGAFIVIADPQGAISALWSGVYDD